MLFLKKKGKKEKEMKFRCFDDEFNIYDFIFEDGYMIKTHVNSGVELERYKLENVLKVYKDTDFKIEKVNKSVVKRAVVGGVLAGGIGAVVGGMSGVGEKNKRTLIEVVNVVYKKNGKVVIDKYRPEFNYKWMKLEDINNKIQEVNNR